MSRRFEQVITAGVAAGVIALAGCSSSSSSGGNADADVQPDGVVEAEFLWGETVSASTIKLHFTDAVQIGNAANAVGLFSLTGNTLNAGVHTFYSETPTTLDGRNVTDMAVGVCDNYCWLGSAYYSFTAGAVAVPAVKSVSASGDTVILTLNGSIPDVADNGTGALRLTYTGDGDGILDADGDETADVSPGITENGNILDTVGPATEAPRLLSARTLSATQVELVFNKAVVVANEGNALLSFALTSNHPFRYETGSIQFGFFADDTSANGADWAAYSGYFVWANNSVTANLNIDYETNIDSAGSLSAIGVPDAAPNHLLITLGTPIPAGIDNTSGRLKLFFKGFPGGIEDEAGNALGNTGFGPLHRGNVTHTPE